MHILHFYRKMGKNMGTFRILFKNKYYISNKYIYLIKKFICITDCK